jgi:hypothetical protein
MFKHSAKVILSTSTITPSRIRQAFYFPAYESPFSWWIKSACMPVKNGLPITVQVESGINLSIFLY